MPYSDLPLRKELVVRREVREPFFEVLKHIPIRHLEGLTEIIVGKFQDESMFAPDGLYYPSFKTIIVSTRAKTTLTLAHEIGHHVYDHVLSNKQILRWRKIMKDKFPELKTPDHFRECFATSYAMHYTRQRVEMFPIIKLTRKRNEVIRRFFTNAEIF